MKNIKLVTSLSLWFIAFSFVFIFLGSVAQAAELGARPANPDPDVSFGKSWFIYKEADIGAKIKDAVQLVNFSDEPAQARVWPADAVTTPDGAYAIKEKEDTIDIGTWITFFENGRSLGREVIIDLGPEESKILDFILEVPSNAEVGDHMGAIMIQEVPEEVETGAEGEVAAGLRIAVRTGARVYLTVPGDIIRLLEFPKFSWERKDGIFRFLLTFENKGNVRIEPRGSIVIKNFFGAEIDELDIPARVVFPKGEITVPVIWENISFWTKYGGFVAEAKVNYGPGLDLSKTIRVVAVPRGLGLALGITILLLILLLVIKILRTRIERKRLGQYIVQEGETTESIAEKFGMSWKKLVKINKLKPPYSLKHGQKILVLEKKERRKEE